MNTSLVEVIRAHGAEWLDLRFTDLKGMVHHLTLDADRIDDAFLVDGLMFDGSSVAGWKAVHQSDMKLMPDVRSAYLDPFITGRTVAVHCSIIEPDTGLPYARDPRSTAQRAEAYLSESGIADTACFGPEAEFYLFDDVRFDVSMNRVSFEVDAVDAAWNSNRRYEGGNLGHRPATKGGYMPLPPVDSGQELRSEMLATMRRIGMKVDKHHHEVGSTQHELGLIFGTLVAQADEMQKYKHIVRNVAQAHGRTATFMPKPVAGDAGSGMHVNMSLWKDDAPLFAGDGYAGLSDRALWFIGGILRHARALNAIANPATNSYKRLVPGFEAPVLRAYSAKNRSGAIRIPWCESAAAKRVEARFPDPAANPYLVFSALLMAGLDGIRNRIDPGEANDRDLYDLPPEESAGLPRICASLGEALVALEQDADFLLAGGVFTGEQIESYLALKRNEIEACEQTPHPMEYRMYYSC